MCCITKFGFIGVLLSMLFGRGGCCPTTVPVQVTLSVAPTSIMAGGGTATLTATLAAASSDDVQLTLDAQQTPAGNAGYTLSAASITIPAGQTQGTATVTSLALGQSANQLSVVFRVSQVTIGTCSWDVDVPAEALTITPADPPTTRPWQPES